MLKYQRKLTKNAGNSREDLPESFMPTQSVLIRLQNLSEGEIVEGLLLIPQYGKDLLFDGDPTGYSQMGNCFDKDR